LALAEIVNTVPIRIPNRWRYSDCILCQYRSFEIWTSCSDFEWC
jgi:hypothetical protein